MGSLSAFVDENGKMRRRVFSTGLDIRDHGSIQNGIAVIETNIIHIGTLMNDSACNIWKPVLDASWEGWSVLLDTDLYGPSFAVQVIVGGMIQRG